MLKVKNHIRNKEVQIKIERHILEFFGSDFGYDSNNPIKNLINQIDFMKLKNESIYNASIRLVEGGTFLISNHDIMEFLENELNINWNKRQTEFDYYKHILAIKIVEIYDSFKGLI